ncbi:MAG: hypothetical protein ACFFEW_12150 [Candidatus Thorarchaeota archaeon]
MYRRAVTRILYIGLLVFGLLFLQLNSQIVLEPPQASPTSPPTKYSLTQNVGDTRSFWANDFDTATHYEIDATLLAIGEHCLIYFQDSLISLLGQEEATSRCESYRNEFDDVIYPKVTELTGNPDGRIGDVDGDPRIIILISDNLMSYYSQYNEIVSTYSNLCEMVYIYYDNYLILDTIAHEFCHLIWFNYEFDEVHFILEGMAEYATYYVGYLSYRGNVSHRTDYFLQTPDDSLIYFDVAQKDYGGSYLFAFYLAERFGVQFLTELVQQEEDGALGIEAALLDAGHNISFNELYLDWVTAITIDELGFADNNYGFANMDVQFQELTVRNTIPVEIESLSIRYYGAEIIKITNPPDNFTVAISQPDMGCTGVSIVYHDSDGWFVQKNALGSPILENVTGNSIDTLYVITSLLFSEASAGNIDFGEGVSDEVDIAITEHSPSEPSTTSGLVPAEWTPFIVTLGISSLVVPIIVAIIVIRKRQNVSETI